MFWLIYVIFLGVLWGSFEDEYGREILAQLILLPPKLIGAYIGLYILLPRFILLRYYTKFILWLIVVLILSGFMQWWLIIYVEQPLLFPDEGSWGPLIFPAKILKQAIGINSVVVIVLLIKLLKTWYADQKASQLLAQEKLSAELKFLKSQIHDGD